MIAYFMANVIYNVYTVHYVMYIYGHGIVEGIIFSNYWIGYIFCCLKH